VKCGDWYAVCTIDNAGHGNGKKLNISGPWSSLKIFGNMRYQWLFDELHGPKKGDF
jgi:hypothetical protein